MTDRFETTTASLNGPAIHAFPVTPDDTAALPETTRALYVGSGGAVTAELQSGAVATFAAVAAGAILPARIVRVLATGTTASSLVGLV
ncbi:hypothetical protein [Rhizobium sp. FKL33]|uniref:spike base protein, RCAP_Rcc01079 family n=1 Tax=Rhizobium sp. FKL33 TaxID=2562307 RepID=UPI0010C11DA4|nr:hypothetical protein [Rhizobium sp. FKL33]